MKATVALIACLVSLVTGCESIDRQSNNAVEIESKSVIKDTSIAKGQSEYSNKGAGNQDVSRDVATPCLTNIQSFYKWYLGVQDTVNYFANSIVFQSDSTGESANRFYIVDRLKKSNYLNFLQKSGFFSKYFLERMNASLEYKMRHIEKIKQHDGEPEGFESDLILFTQDLDPNTDNFRYKFRNNRVEVDNGENVILFYLSKDCSIDSTVFNGRSERI
ncbi:hypothetical protein [Hymenobacter elongatus]|uniref:Lipoprotein n=1 Tax=Hymenobacter elongatus TaxID=877208 RepID=A0A4Z0PNC3_9BACT|nr:hypothetical protein [Hymenobacter elongatus]TGE17547.1 hypothetical protein E5J99_06755 [Hymenobacter elongatus]